MAITVYILDVHYANYLYPQIQDRERSFMIIVLPALSSLIGTSTC